MTSIEEQYKQIMDDSTLSDGQKMRDTRKLFSTLIETFLIDQDANEGLSDFCTFLIECDDDGNTFKQIPAIVIRLLQTYTESKPMMLRAFENKDTSLIAHMYDAVSKTMSDQTTKRGRGEEDLYGMEEVRATPNAKRPFNTQTTGGWNQPPVYAYEDEPIKFRSCMPLRANTTPHAQRIVDVTDNYAPTPRKIPQLYQNGQAQTARNVYSQPYTTAPTGTGYPQSFSGPESRIVVQNRYNPESQGLARTMGSNEAFMKKFIQDEVKQTLENKVFPRLQELETKVCGIESMNSKLDALMGMMSGGIAQPKALKDYTREEVFPNTGAAFKNAQQGKWQLAWNNILTAQKTPKTNAIIMNHLHADPDCIGPVGQFVRLVEGKKNEVVKSKKSTAPDEPVEVILEATLKTRPQTHTASEDPSQDPFTAVATDDADELVG